MDVSHEQGIVLKEDSAFPITLEADRGIGAFARAFEYYSGVGPWVEEAKRLGFDVLLNEHRVIRRGDGVLLLAGVTDSSAGGFVPAHASDPHKAIAGSPPADVRILLAHQPRSLYEAGGNRAAKIAPGIHLRRYGDLGRQFSGGGDGYPGHGDE